jgi:hypothetical protein
MQSSPQSVSALQPVQGRRRDDVTYQIITIAAMLIVLVSVWVF